jgi:hypothetical protein
MQRSSEILGLDSVREMVGVLVCYRHKPKGDM